MRILSGITMAIQAADNGAVAIIQNDYSDSPRAMYHVLESPDEVSVFFSLMQTARDSAKGVVNDSKALHDLSRFLGRRVVPYRLVVVYHDGKWLHQPWELAMEEFQVKMQNPEAFQEPVQLVSARIA